MVQGKDFSLGFTFKKKSALTIYSVGKSNSSIKGKEKSQEGLRKCKVYRWITL